MIGLIEGNVLLRGLVTSACRGSGLWAREGVEVEVPLGVEDTASSEVDLAEAFEVLLFFKHVHSTYFLVLFIILAMSTSRISVLSLNGSELIGIGQILVR